MENGVHTTKEKALSLNLNENIYGSLAEIGGGQEVAANFFKAGGASGTIAKTMSAYDMNFSDAIYGETERYVCEEKLMKMLNKEYNLLSKRLTHREENTKFFAYANTVETINYKKTNKGHGWIGVRFQLTPQSEPNDCILHLVLNDPDALWQQEVLGRVGVNILYACFNHYDDPEQLMTSIVDNLSKDRLDIDMFRLEGPDFKTVDNRLMSLQLVKNGMTHAAMFDEMGRVMQPSTFLYKKNICLLRGRFRPVTKVNMDMLNKGLDQFNKDENVDERNIKNLCELTLSDLTNDGEIDENDFMDRVDLLNSLGLNVVITDFTEHYRLAHYLAQYTNGRKMGFIIGINNLGRIFDETYYNQLKGGIMESFGRLFGSNIKLLIYPQLSPELGVETASNFEPASHLVHLYKHLHENQYIDDILAVDEEILKIFSEDVLRMIHKDESGWEEHVPENVADLIKTNSMFGYTNEAALKS